MIISRDKREIELKLVYYGPGLAGKMTNMQYVFERTHPEKSGTVIAVAPEYLRTLSFDFVPKSLAPVNGMRLRFRLYTCPSNVWRDPARRLALEGADGVAFVADSQRERSEANAECLEHLEEELGSHGIALRELPIVLQYNKQDLPNSHTPTELDAHLNRRHVPSFAAVARKAEGVFDTFRCVAKEMIARIPQDVPSLDTPYRG